MRYGAERFSFDIVNNDGIEGNEPPKRTYAAAFSTPDSARASSRSATGGAARPVSAAAPRPSPAPVLWPVTVSAYHKATEPSSRSVIVITLSTRVRSEVALISIDESKDDDANRTIKKTRSIPVQRESGHRRCHEISANTG